MWADAEEIRRNLNAASHGIEQHLKRLKTIWPNDDLLNGFDQIAHRSFKKPYWERVGTQSLSELLDSLLPKLLAERFEWRTLIDGWRP